MNMQLVFLGLSCLACLLLAGRIVQAEIHARRLQSLLNDLATMIGELFDTLGGAK